MNKFLLSITIFLINPLCHPMMERRPAIKRGSDETLHHPKRTRLQSPAPTHEEPVCGEVLHPSVVCILHELFRAVSDGNVDGTYQASQALARIYPSQTERPTFRNSAGQTALGIAVDRGDLACMQALFLYGHDTHALTLEQQERYTALVTLSDAPPTTTGMMD